MQMRRQMPSMLCTLFSLSPDFSCSRSSLLDDSFNQCSGIHDILVWIRIRIWIRGSMPLTNGSGSGSCYFRHWPSRCQQNTRYFLKSCSAYHFSKVLLHHFSKIKIQKKSQNSRNQDCSYCFCLLIEGSIPLSNRSGSGRPKNMWIRWIRIRIRNTAFNNAVTHRYCTGSLEFFIYSLYVFYCGACKTINLSL